MKIVLAGAFGNLGAEILKVLCDEGHEVVAADLRERQVDGTEGKYTFRSIDATDPATLEGLCDGADAVITTVGLTGASTRFTAYDIDQKGNLNLCEEAKRAGVKKFHYISVISCDEPGAEEVPMLHAKYLVEQELKKQPMDWVIYRPTGYFYDICKVFKPYVDKGEMQLLKGYGKVRANVVDCADFARFIADHLNDANVTYNIGGKETYTYEEMAKLCFDAAGKPLKIKWAPMWLFGVLAKLPKVKKEGKRDVILFSRWTLSHDLVGDTEVGEKSFAEYIKEYFDGSGLAVTDGLLRTIEEKYPLKACDTGEFSALKANGMRFTVEAYEAEGLGHVSVMKAKGFGGMMKMDTLIVNPKERDLPLYSYDRILAMGNDTLIAELYDTSVGGFVSPETDALLAENAALPERDPGTHWYDDIRLAQSISKKGKKAHSAAFDSLAKAHFAAWLNAECQPLTDKAAKQKKTAAYVDGLLAHGGPSTDVFKKALGREKTEILFRKVLFGTEKE